MPCKDSSGASRQVATVGHVRGLTEEEIEQWRIPALYVSIAFGKPEKVLAWTCPACTFVPKPLSIKTGGNGQDVPRCMSPLQASRANSSRADLSARRHDGSLILAFSGTDVRSPASIGVSLDLRLMSIEAEHFLGMDVKSVQVHRGFYKCFRKVKDAVLAVVKAELDKGAHSVILAGYSLGAGLAFLSGLWLRCHLARDVDIRILGYGTPRLGNQAWANLINAEFGSDAARLVNYKDVVCRIPPTVMGYRHAGAEVFISKDGKQYGECMRGECPECSGRFDTSRGWLKVLHATRHPKTLFHYGPYAGVLLHPDLFASSPSIQVLGERPAQLKSHHKLRFIAPGHET